MSPFTWDGGLSGTARSSALNWPPHLASSGPMPRESYAAHTLPADMNPTPLAAHGFAIHPQASLTSMAIAPYYHRSAAHSPPHPMHAYASPPPPVHAPEPEPEPVRIREKRHSCAMCHKSFDRPSTLRKHLLVHTGEKAFACDTCGRRFGVASNLNRHVRRCILRPVHARGSVTPATPDERAPSAESSPTMASSASPPASSPEASTVSSTSRARASPVEPHAARPKRRRRAPSPARWVPPSLVEFDLSLYKKSCPVPLAPEAEHDWDTCEEQVPFNPYHPDGWKGRLPGPGRDIINTSMTVGRLVLY